MMGFDPEEEEEVGAESADEEEGEPDADLADEDEEEM